MPGVGECYRGVDGPRLCRVGRSQQGRNCLLMPLPRLALDRQELSAAARPPLGKLSRGFLGLQEAPA